MRCCFFLFTDAGCVDLPSVGMSIHQLQRLYMKEETTGRLRSGWFQMPGVKDDELLVRSDHHYPQVDSDDDAVFHHHNQSLLLFAYLFNC